MLHCILQKRLYGQRFVTPEHYTHMCFLHIPFQMSSILCCYNNLDSTEILEHSSWDWPIQPQWGHALVLGKEAWDTVSIPVHPKRGHSCWGQVSVQATWVLHSKLGNHVYWPYFFELSYWYWFGPLSSSKFGCDGQVFINVWLYSVVFMLLVIGIFFFF